MSGSGLGAFNHYQQTIHNVRNWWVETEADGVRSTATGPQAANGGIHITILARDGGRVVNSFRIDVQARPDGRLLLRVFGPDGAEVARHETTR
jgi:hypothetical protein